MSSTNSPAVSFIGGNWNIEIPMNHKLTFRIKNDLTELGKISQIVEEFNETHRLPLKAVNAVSLALDEILTNIISYGYEEQGDHFIDIRISLQNEQIILEIEDDARQFNPLTVPEADTESAINERPIGGLGVHLVRNMMDEIHYIYKNNKNCLLMKKKIKEV